MGPHSDSGRGRRAAGMLLAAGLLSAAAAPSAHGQAQGQDPPILQLFERCDLRGWQASFARTGHFDTVDLRGRGGLDNQASAVRIAPGFEGRLYDKDQQSGAYIIVAGSDFCLSDRGFDNVTSSLKIEPLVINPVVQLFEHRDFAGWVAPFTTLGNFNAADLLDRGGRNNRASSVSVEAGYKVILFKGDNQTGESVEITANTSGLDVFGFNDVTSSLRVEKIDCSIP